MPAIANASGGPVAANTTPSFTFVLVNAAGTPISGAALQTLTLTIADTLTGTVINGVSAVNILNTNRGTIDNLGNLTITLEVADTALPETPVPPQIQRSLIIDWAYNGGVSVGRHQSNFIIVNLVGA